MPTTKELAEHLLLTAPDHVGWSLVESPNATGSYDDLLRWSEELNVTDWFTDRRVRAPELGLVLLWLESEVARRHGGDGSLWPILSNREVVGWLPGIHSELFLPGGQATQAHRDLLRQAALHYSLRHTFEDEDGQNWYRLIYLQFGFTHDDAVERLAPWLSGQILPVSVQRLLEAADRGAQEFQYLWRSLRMFRLGNLNKPTVEARLKSNPWVLPGWCADLIKAAEKSSAQVLEVADLDAADVRFFTLPRLSWQEQGEPCFAISLCNLDELELDANTYHFKAGDKLLATLIRQDDGSYYSDAPEEIILPIESRVALSLVGIDGRIAAHDEAVLWDAIEEITTYSGRSGQMIPPGQRLRTGTELFVIASHDVTFSPSPAESFDLPLGYVVHRIPSGWTGPLLAKLDDDVVWTSSLSPTAQPLEAVELSARFTQGIDLRYGEMNHRKPPWRLPIHFNLPDGWSFARLRWRRGDGQLIELSKQPEFLSLVEMDAIKPVVLRVRITSGNRHRTEVLKVSVPFVAALKWTEQGALFYHSPERKLLIAEAQRQTWSFNLPSLLGEPRDPRLCSYAEGHLLHGRLKTRPTTLPKFAGYGAPLTIVDDPYQSPRPVMEVAPCVLDGGAIGSVKWLRDEDGFHIKSSFTELGDDHHLLIWVSCSGGGSEVRSIPPEELRKKDDGWFWQAGEHLQLHALALIFRGARLGSWFDFLSWSKAVVESPPNSRVATAAMLRFWKAPLLQEDGEHFRTVSRWFADHWPEILPVWLAKLPCIGPDGQYWPMRVPDEQWQVVIRELLAKVLPSPDDESCVKIVESLAPQSVGIEALGATLWNLAENSCPILAVRVARIYLKKFVSAADRRSFFHQLLDTGIEDLSIAEGRAEKIARQHGNRDGFWLQQTVPPLGSIDQLGAAAIPHAYRFLSNSKDYRLYALGRWMREIR